VQGLGNTVDHLLLHAEHQFCVRHLHANCKGNRFMGKVFKDELWAATWTSNATFFQHHMKVIQGMDAYAYKYLDDVNPTSWSTHAFSTHSNSNMLLNNLGKTFNA